MAVEAQGRRREAKTWLEDLLAEGPVAAKEIQQEAKAAGLSWITVRRAKDALSVVANKGGYQGAWQWSLAKDAHTEDSKDAHSIHQVSTFDDAHHAKVSAFEQTGGAAKDAQMSAFQERDGRLFLSGKAWLDLEIGSLAARHMDFVELAESHPRLAGESLSTWCRRLIALCDERNIFLPRHFFARTGDAPAA